MLRTATLLLCAAMLLLGTSRFAMTCFAAAPGTVLRGTKVLPKEGAVFKIGRETVEDANFPLPYIVQDVKGDWLWVGSDRKGWVQRSQVVTIEEAPEYYTQMLTDGRQKAWAYNLRAIAWQHKGDLDLAIADFGERLRLEPDATTFSNRADAWRLKGQFDKAIADCDHAIRLDPDSAFAYNNRGMAWSGKREYGKAIADFNQAVRLDPAFLEGYNNTAWLLATCPDENFRNGKRAVALATKACELSEWTIAASLDTLAAAHAEAGNFDMAIRYEKRAIELGSHDRELRKGTQQRLALFLDHNAFQDE